MLTRASKAIEFSRCRAHCAGCVKVIMLNNEEVFEKWEMASWSIRGIVDEPGIPDLDFRARHSGAVGSRHRDHRSNPTCQRFKVRGVKGDGRALYIGWSKSGTGARHLLSPIILLHFFIFICFLLTDILLSHNVISSLSGLATTFGKNI